MFLSVHHGRNGVNDFLISGAVQGENMMIVVAAALIAADGSIMVQQRREGGPHGGLWEFPGGKCEAGESLRDALARELEEELGIRVATEALESLVFAAEPAGDQELLLLLFTCRDWQGEPRALDAQALRWCAPAELLALPMPPADIPLARKLARRVVA